MNHVVPGGKDHQHQDDGQTDAETDVLSPRAERMPADCLYSVEQQVPPIQQRDGKEGVFGADVAFAKPEI